MTRISPPSLFDGLSRGYGDIVGPGHRKHVVKLDQADQIVSTACGSEVEAAKEERDGEDMCSTTG